ncbi:MAG TPA: cation transporter [Syntrophomonadaceae bacterium]|jgi:cation diffusion facilitator family transporter|nr:cation transporter [Syntrophomonadaceae bacterium]
MNAFTRSITDFLIRNTQKNVEDIYEVNDPVQRQGFAYLEAWMSIIGNVVLAIVKFVFGFMLNSISLIADAVHTASDVLTSLVVILGFKLSSLPADEKHPHGHGRIEFIATLVIAIMLIIVGVKFGFSSYERLKANTPVQGSYLVVGVMLLAALLKELMSQISIDLGQRISSGTLIADAWHHRTDAIASVLVAIAILASGFGYYKVDAILGFGVSALIIWTGMEIFSDSASKLIGETNQEDIAAIEQLALSVSGVADAHDIAIHDYGNSKHVVMHIEVDEKLTVIEAHSIAERVEHMVNQNMWVTTTVHVDRVGSSS